MRPAVEQEGLSGPEQIRNLGPDAAMQGTNLATHLIQQLGLIFTYQESNIFPQELICNLRTHRSR